MKYYIIPEPVKQIEKGGEFYLNYNTEIVLNKNCGSREYGYAKLLAETIKEKTGFCLSVRKGEPKGCNEIFLNLLKSFEDTCASVVEYNASNKKEEIAAKLQEESYRLEILPGVICITAMFSQGLLYGVQTLRQLFSQLAMVLPCMEIEDRPAIAYRGFYHDATRGRVQKLEYYKRLADKVSYYKMNQLQLYVEHTYLFQGMSELWRDDTPLTAEEIMELDVYCQDIGVELVPSLASFGHLDKLMKTKTYAHLCELEGSDKERFTFWGRMAHHTINPTEDESWELIKSMLLEFMPLFSSKHFNLCGDETFDLGMGRSKGVAEKIGKQRLYVEFVKKICELLVQNGRRPMFWGDVIAESPELLSELPESVICLTWGYSPEEKEDSARKMNEVGAVQYLCPGVHGWRHLMNRLSDAYGNIERMCSYAKKYQALGFLVTDWGDYGHISHPSFSIPGLIYGAAGGWCGNLMPEEEMNRRISLLEYHDVTEQFAGLVSELSKQEAMGWDSMVHYMEYTTSSLQPTKEEIQGLLGYVDIAGIEEKNAKIDELLSALAKISAGLNVSAKEVLPAYFLHAEGQKLFNQIIGVIAKYELEMEVAAKLKEPRVLAAELETWFYEYKQLWRRTCKESELYRMQNLMFWYADLLREL